MNVAPKRLACCLTVLSAALCALQPVTPCAASGTVASCGAVLAIVALALGGVGQHRGAATSIRAMLAASALALVLNLVVVH